MPLLKHGVAENTVLYLHGVSLSMHANVLMFSCYV